MFFIIDSLNLQLAHGAQEVRLRSLKNINFKLSSGLISLDSLLQEPDFPQSLVTWLCVSPNNMDNQKAIIEILKALIEVQYYFCL